jgi:hypothetical protein
MRKPLNEQLDENTLNQLASALPRIAILIGGADGHFDLHEKAWAEKLVNIRSYSAPKGLEELYELANDSFSAHMDELLQSYSMNTADRNDQLVLDLQSVNSILASLDPETAWLVYDSLRSFAWHIARASGGFLGMGAINKDEEYWLSLPMINKPEQPASTEEE